MFSGDDGGQHISLQKNFNQIKMCEEKKKKKKMNLTFNTQKQMHFLHNLPCPALHQVDIKDLDKQSLFQYNYHISQLWGFTRPRHFRLINKPLTNLNSSAMTHPALALQFNGK